MEAYDTLSEAMHALKAQGYQTDFNLKSNCIVCENQEYEISHDEFHIDKSFRFDDNEDPGDQSMLYAISSEKYQLKGLLVNGYGIYSDSLTNEMLKKLK